MSSMTTWPSLRKFNDAGMRRYRELMRTGEQNGIDPLDHILSVPVRGTTQFTSRPFSTRRDMAETICSAFGSLCPGALQAESGLWAWLTWVLRDQLFPRDSRTGRARYGETYTWDPAPPRNWLKFQRHKVRMPVLLWSTLGQDADHLLCGDPARPGELMSQLTSQQDMMAPAFQRLCRKLYFDDRTGQVREGAAGSGPGSARHLARIRRQLEVTWDLSDMDTDQMLRLLPPAFNRFLRHA